jgi:hypothetical protein
LSSPLIGKRKTKKWVSEKEGRKEGRGGKGEERNERKSGWGEGAGYTELIGPS